MTTPNNITEMESPSQVRSILIKLIPFMLSIVTYFCGFVPHTDKVLLAFTKCLPILCLMIFIGLYLIDIRPEYYTSSFAWYVKMIFLGLFFSGIGDALLIWPTTFQFCIVAFITAQIHYILAFGFQPRGWLIGIFSYSVSIAASYFLSSGLSGIDMFLVPLHSLILTTTTWRATAPLADKIYWPTLRWTAVFGSTIVALSHFVIGIEKFKMHIMYVNELDMIMYYTGQFLITLSILEPHFQTSNPDSKLI